MGPSSSPPPANPNTVCATATSWPTSTRWTRDGANIRQVGRSTLFEGHSCLLPDGRILYDRWEYVDRNFGDAQGLWTCNPDGTNHAVYWGNNTPAPGGAIDPRCIPGTQQVSSVCFGSCHDRPWGGLAIIDRRLGIDGRGSVVRTWPAHAIERVKEPRSDDQYGFDDFKSVTPKYEDPFPLNDKLFPLFADDRRMERGWGVFLIDVFGNEVLLHVEGPGCYDPMPLRSYPRPPVIPSTLDFGKDEGVCFCFRCPSGDIHGRSPQRIDQDSARCGVTRETVLDTPLLAGARYDRTGHELA